MPKHHWRQQVKSIFEGHVDPDKHEQLKESRQGMEEKKEKIIKLIKSEEQDGSNGITGSLEELVNDYHKEYASLYELYHNLTGELRRKVHGNNKEEKEKFSSSSSDSDDYSTKGSDGKNAQLQNELQGVIDGLQQELEAANCEINELRNKHSVLSDERSQLMGENDELKVKLETYADVEVKLNKQVEELTRDMASKTDVFTAQLNSLEKEVETVRAQKSELEEQLINRDEASSQMKELFDQVNSFQNELTKLATLKAEMESELERKSQEQKRVLEENESLADRTQALESEFESLSKHKSELETETAELLAEVAELKLRITNLEGSVVEKENECAALASKIQDGEDEASSKIAALAADINKYENENAELRSKVVDLELNLRAAERNAEELSRGNQSNDQLIIELQTTIEDLNRDIEMDKDELMTIEEKNRNLEVMLRLSNQKLRVTEQLLSEKEANLLQLEDKNAALRETLEAYSEMIRDISEQASSSLAGLESAITRKFNEDYGGLAKAMATLTEEVQGIKSWVETTRKEKEEIIQKLEKEEEEGVRMREEIEKLKAEAMKEKAEKEEATRALREKDERLTGLGEEKREAIRQLCVWIEYHRTRCSELREILLKVVPKARRTTATS